MQRLSTLELSECAVRKDEGIYEKMLAEAFLASVKPVCDSLFEGGERLSEVDSFVAMLQAGVVDAVQEPLDKFVRGSVLAANRGGDDQVVVGGMCDDDGVEEYVMYRKLVDVQSETDRMNTGEYSCGCYEVSLTKEEAAVFGEVGVGYDLKLGSCLQRLYGRYVDTGKLRDAFVARQVDVDPGIKVVLAGGFLHVMPGLEVGTVLKDVLLRDNPSGKGVDISGEYVVDGSTRVGLCYLAMVKFEYRYLLLQYLGQWPGLSSVKSVPNRWKVERWADLRCTVVKSVVHVDARGDQVFGDVVARAPDGIGIVGAYVERDKLQFKVSVAGWDRLVGGRSMSDSVVLVACLEDKVLVDGALREAGVSCANRPVVHVLGDGELCVRRYDVAYVAAGRVMTGPLRGFTRQQYSRLPEVCGEAIFLADIGVGEAFLFYLPVAGMEMMGRHVLLWDIFGYSVVVVAMVCASWVSTLQLPWWLVMPVIVVFGVVGTAMLVSMKAAVREAFVE